MLTLLDTSALHGSTIKQNCTQQRQKLFEYQYSLTKEKPTWDNILTAQMSEHKTILLISIYQHLLYEMSVFTVVSQGIYNTSIHQLIVSNSVSAHSATRIEVSILNQRFCPPTKRNIGGFRQRLVWL